MKRTMELDRMADDMGLNEGGEPRRVNRRDWQVQRRAEIARVAGAVANILETELKRQEPRGSTRINLVQRRETPTGSEQIVLRIGGVEYNLTVTRAR